jgi:hypothetical protein
MGGQGFPKHRNFDVNKVADRLKLVTVAAAVMKKSDNKIRIVII